MQGVGQAEQGEVQREGLAFGLDLASSHWLIFPAGFIFPSFFLFGGKRVEDQSKGKMKAKAWGFLLVALVDLSSGLLFFFFGQEKQGEHSVNGLLVGGLWRIE